MATDEPRCPYCIEENGFKLLTLIRDTLRCGRCGHMLRPADANFICNCPHCERMRLTIGSESGETRPETKSRATRTPTSQPSR